MSTVANVAVAVSREDEVGPGVELGAGVPVTDVREALGVPGDVLVGLGTGVSPPGTPEPPPPPPQPVAASPSETARPISAASRVFRVVRTRITGALFDLASRFSGPPST